MNVRGNEIEDKPWLPNSIRAGMTDYLQFLFSRLNLYSPVIPILYKIVEKREVLTIVDLCSGSGGAVYSIWLNLKKHYNTNLKFILTDLYPNLSTYQYLSNKSGGNITFIKSPVDATRVPPGLNGFRTIFSGIHHFRESQVKEILKNVVISQQGIGIFDGGDKNIWMILLIIIFHPLALLFLTPFLKPFRWKKLFFTYIIPAIPLFTVWDGILSILSLYKPTELLNLANEVESKTYKWQAGKVRNKFGLRIGYLVGLPSHSDDIFY
jgi:hypothetical protein